MTATNQQHDASLHVAAYYFDLGYLPNMFRKAEKAAKASGAEGIFWWRPLLPFTIKETYK
jgi:hypothetical protein